MSAVNPTKPNNAVLHDGRHSQSVLDAQPSPAQPMDPLRPQRDDNHMSLRGGHDGQGACPGRFCFIIPCPLPCNFCVFPCPC
ncbi:hypothetical protein LX32DRAFT_640245 [Colletotrichum zoysiae]|uniref:Uncharacterized protein n=1 Tax=Colletotrichum zoysiae TaxID=1216348 RepID=A0AAD9HGX8_9PEZI|nr:hypothetical protein LX32DRAFT_640245 [Colletotrichum zoysiae]